MCSLIQPFVEIFSSSSCQSSLFSKKNPTQPTIKPHIRIQDSDTTQHKQDKPTYRISFSRADSRSI